MPKQLVGNTTAIIVIILTIFFQRCKKDEPANNNNNQSSIENTYGFGILSKLQGIWNGPVTSTTALGGYPEWVVDFRAISENQISAKNELDTMNDIHMSFFIAKHNGQYKVCFRNGGSFAGQTRVSYLLADSVSETASQSYYRFSEIIIGKNRAYTEVTFRNDSLLIRSYTNRYNTLPSPTPHMSWNAKLQDVTSGQPASAHFGFPKKTLTKDFSETFAGHSESIYYSVTGGDPYPESEQPYLGQATISYDYAPGFIPNASKKVFIIITTQPMIDGFSFDTSKLKFRSRYVVLAANDLSYTFNYMHPGTYYLHAVYDADGNQQLSSGDWVSASNASFIVPAESDVSAATEINFMIP